MTTDCPICNSFPRANTPNSHLPNSKNLERKCPVCGQNCGKPALLDLFSGAGGAARGYQKAGFCVLGVDIKPQPHYAGCRFVQADALTYPLEGFDAYHASPPCQRYSYGTPNKALHPDLIGVVRQLLSETGKTWVIENVPGAPLRADFVITGDMVGLVLIKRKRLFETNWWAGIILMTKYEVSSPVITVTGHGTTSGNRATWGRNIKVAEMRAAMNIDWMNRDELSQAIPPAYTEFIGKHLIVTMSEDNLA